MTRSSPAAVLHATIRERGLARHGGPVHMDDAGIETLREFETPIFIARHDRRAQAIGDRLRTRRRLFAVVTAPNVSSVPREQMASVGTWVRMVGAKILPLARPPVTTRAPRSTASRTRSSHWRSARSLISGPMIMLGSVGSP